MRAGGAPPARPASGGIRNLSRRAMLGGGAAAGLVLGLRLPRRAARAQAADATPHATKVAAYLAIRPDGGIRLRSPFAEGGQGIHTAVAQILAEELDADPARFAVETAPPGPDHLVVDGGGRRLTGNSLSVRASFAHFRRLGATARAMLIEAAAAQWGVPAAECATEPGRVLHPPSGRAAGYGALAEAAAALAPPPDVPLKRRRDFRLIGREVPPLDLRARATGALAYAIDLAVEGMLQAAVVHAPRAGAEPGALGNEAEVRAMPGVHSIHPLPGAVAVVADGFWRAQRAAAALQVVWTALTGPLVPEGFSSSSMRDELRAARGRAGNPAEEEGDAEAALGAAVRVVEAVYDAPYLAHAQLEPPSAIARFNRDGSLDLWTPNQAPEAFQAAAAREAGIDPGRVRIHSPPLGGFFGRHYPYAAGLPMPQAILLARATGRPVKVIWTREQEFARDAYRPLSCAGFRAGLDSQGNLVALHAAAYGEGPATRHEDPSVLGTPPVDPSVVEGLRGLPYRIPHRRVEFVPVPHPAGVNLGHWRSGGHSANAFFLESFLDEVAEAAGRDPFAFRQALLQHSPRHLALLQAVAALAGGWRRDPYDAPDGTRRARGLAMASLRGTETATIAEISLREGGLAVHEVWVAVDPGRAVNPGLLAAQVEGAVALGLSAALLEEVVIEGGAPATRNFDRYPVLRAARMPRVHTRILESGAPLGGIGEAGTPGVAPALGNAVAALTGRRIRSLPFSRARLGGG